MMMPSLKYCFAALVLGAGSWVPAPYRTPLIIGVTGLLAGLFLAALVLDRQFSMREMHSQEETDEGGLALAVVARPRRVLLIGSGEVAAELARSLETEDRYRIVGYVDEMPVGPLMNSWPWLGGPETTSAICREHEIEEVIVVAEPSWQVRLAESIASSQQSVTVQMVPSAASTLLDFSAIDSFDDIAVVPVRDPRKGVHDLTKRLFDLATAGIGLVLALPAMVCIGAAIRLTSPGAPAVFSQERVGRNGKTFVLYKFRTMVPDAEARTGPVLSSGEDDERLTPLGKWLRAFRVDELPQLWNVVRGDMSLVGPRPERPCFVAEYNEVIPGYAQRHLVRPGMTGLAQVCGGYHTTPADKLRFDLAYVAHRSLRFDLEILYRTVAVVCRPTPK